MPKLTLDGTDYDTENMSEEALAQVQAIQFADGELARIQMKGAALQTAKNAYVRALKGILEEGESKEDEASIDLPEDLNFD